MYTLRHLYCVVCSLALACGSGGIDLLSNEPLLTHSILSSDELGRISNDWVDRMRTYPKGPLPDPETELLADLARWRSTLDVRTAKVIYQPGTLPLTSARRLGDLLGGETLVATAAEGGGPKSGSGGSSGVGDGEAYDLAVSDEALQCAFDPLLALVDLRQQLRPRGHLLLVSSMHGPVRKDTYFRFTHSGAATLLKQAGFQVVGFGALNSATLAADSYGDVPIATGQRPPVGRSSSSSSSSDTVRPGRVYERELGRGVPVDFWFLARRIADSSPGGGGGGGGGGSSQLLLHPRLTPSQLEALWTRHASKPPAYFAQHRHPLQATSAPLQNLLTAHRDYPRVPIALEFYAWSRRHNFTLPKRFLTTDPTDVELHSLSAGAVETVCAHVHRPPSSSQVEGGDLHKLTHKVVLRGEPFDLAVVSQTLEHLYDPLLALVNLRRKLTPGGLLFTSTPTVNRPHMTPFHFRHYSPMGLAALLTQAGFEIVELGQWGNARYLENLFALSGMNWPSFVQGHVTSEKGAVENDPLRPVQVWALARRPLSDGDATPAEGAPEPRYKRPQDNPCFYAHPRDRRGRKTPDLPSVAIAAMSQDGGEEGTLKKRGKKKGKGVV